MATVTLSLTVVTPTIRVHQVIRVAVMDVVAMDVDRIDETEPNQPLQHNAGDRPLCESALSSAWLI